MPVREGRPFHRRELVAKPKDEMLVKAENARDLQTK
jgi:hypothetical protein